MVHVSARSARVFGAALAAFVSLSVAACSSGSAGTSTLRPASTDTPGTSTGATGTATSGPSAGTSPKRSPTPASKSSAARRAAAAKAAAIKASRAKQEAETQSKRANSPSRGTSSRPPAAPSGWKLSWSDDFTGSSLGAGWGDYTGPIASMPGGTWAADQVEVSNGMLNLHSSKSGGRWTSGGVMNYGPAQQTYGKYLVRFRMERAPGVKYAIILWPASGVWPDDGEIDFGEDGGGSRRATSATAHWGTGSDHHQSQRGVKADFSSWHTIGVEWTPGKLVYTLDGRAYGSVTGSFVPSKPMNLVLQTEAGSCGPYMTCADSTTPAVTTLNVDWVAAYRSTR